MTTDTQRHEAKIEKFTRAVERAGQDTVLNKIGRGSFSSFTCAKDAKARNQPAGVVASFLAVAQDRADEFCKLQSDESIYMMLDSL